MTFGEKRVVARQGLETQSLTWNVTQNDDFFPLLPAVAFCYFICLSSAYSSALDKSSLKATSVQNTVRR